MKRKAVRLMTTLVLLATLLALVVPPALAEGPEPNPPGNPQVSFRGVIEAKISRHEWKVSGRTVLLNDQTVILEQAGPAEVGATVQVNGAVQQGGAVLARLIKVLKPAERPVQFTAPIRELPSGGVIGEWKVGQEIVVVTADTKILPEGVVPQVGDIAHVIGVRKNDNKVYARMIQIRKPQQVIVNFTGPIERFSDTQWVVRGVTVAITAETVIEGTPEVGRIAEVKGYLQPDRSVIAIHIKVREPQQEPVSFQGIIVSKTSDGFPSVWGIRPLTPAALFPGVISVTVTISTTIDETKGPADIGALVHVTAYPVPVTSTAANSALVARHIKVLRPPMNQEITFAGKIEEIHPEFWIVRGFRVLITSATVIDGDTPAVGKLAVVTGILRTDRVVEASHITVKDVLVLDFNGVIRAKAPTIPGFWMIAPDGPLPVILPVWVTLDTVIDETAGPANVGAHVHVLAHLSSSGRIVAQKIVVLPAVTD